MRTKSLLGILAGLAVVTAASTASATEYGLRSTFGFGGEMKSTTTAGGQEQTSKDDLQTTFGLHGQVLYNVLGRNVKIGGLFGFTTLQTDSGDKGSIDRTWYVDIGLVAKGAYELSMMPIELFAQAHIGPAIGIPPANLKDKTGQDVSVAPGVTFGFGGGAQYIFAKTYGFGVDLGYSLHYSKHSWKTAAGAEGKTGVSTGQFTLGVNLNYRTN